MSIQKPLTAAAVAILFAGCLVAGAPAHADGAGAFVGGMVTAKVLNNMSRRTKAQEYQAYNSQPAAQPAQQAAPAAAPQSTEQKLAELDKLAAGGYITPDEYKARRQAILGSM
jgi:hypothetical protein